MTSNWDRQQNPRAKAKKERAKQHAPASHGPLGTYSEVQGCVVWVGANAYTVRKSGKELQCTKVAELDSPVVGDMVYLQNNQIIGIMDRYNYLARFRGDATREGSKQEQVLVSNIHRAIIVASVAQPEFHPRFIDRYLILCQLGKVTPIICLTKTDLTTERPEILREYRKLGIHVVEVSTRTGEGLDDLRVAIRGGSVVFVGASGVGKSSLVNALLQREVTKEGEVGEKTGRGKHTTTATQMYEWDAHSYIIDTPGIRSLDLSDLQPEEIQLYFPEFEPFRGACKFRNCLHFNEPDCAVRIAVKAGDISEERYVSYIRLVTNNSL